MKLDEKLTRFFKALKMSVISDRAGVPQSSLSKYASGRSIPNATAAFRISKALGVSADWLLDDDQSWPPVWKNHELREAGVAAAALSPRRGEETAA
ncbi:MAG: helix-turn-helix transcriptional regulator, partial [Planctomycetota bacterium]